MEIEGALRNLRILHFAHRMCPPCYGGLSVYADTICQLHAKKGHLVEAWTTLEDNRPKVEFSHGYLVRRFRPLIGPNIPIIGLFGNPLTISMLPALLRHGNPEPEIMVAHSHLMFTTFAAMIKARLSHCPLVLVSHGYAVIRGPVFDRLLEMYIITISRTIARSSSALVALTAREASRFLKLGVPRERCVVIPTGVHTDFFQPGDGNPRIKRIVWAGRFVPEKNLECLVTAFAQLRARIPDVELVLAGEGPERRKLLKLSRNLNVEAHVRFPGFLSTDEVLALLQGASIFALPSISEALPIAILEAMSCGVPLVVSKGLGLEEVVDGSGLFADPKDPKEWAATIERLFKDEKLRNSLALRARKLAVERYDWQKIADRLEELFVSLVR